MSVSTVTSSSGVKPADWRTSLSSVKTDFKSLADALKSGNLSDAQTAFAALQKDLPAKATSDVNSPLTALGTALQSGDLAAAQQALATFRPQHQGGHHHHHRSSGGDSATPAASITAEGTGTTLNAIA